MVGGLPTPLNWLHQGVGESQGFYAVGAAISGGINQEPFHVESGPLSGASQPIEQFRGWRFFADEYSANEYAIAVAYGRNNEWNKDDSPVEVKKLKIKNTGPLMYKKDGRAKAKPLFGPLTDSFYVSKWGLKPEGQSRYINQVVVIRINLGSKSWSEKEFGPYY